MSFWFQSSSKQMLLTLSLGVGKRGSDIVKCSNIISKCQRDTGGDKKESVSSKNFQSY